MPAFLSCHKLSKSFGARTLFEDLDFHLGPTDRVGVIGANGSGKTTLLKILAGTEEADSGERMQRKGLRVGLVDQDPDLDPALTVSQSLAEALEDNPVDPSEDQVQRNVRVDAILGRLGFPDTSQRIDKLSGGWQKRLAIARALVCQPDLLLMDEPTNHLDLAGILWLEQQLRSSRQAFVVVSHDRIFLDRVAGRVVELDPRFPGGLLSVDGGYTNFLQKRAEALAARSKTEQALANKVRRELEWLRRGPKARTTKAESRLKEADALMADLARMRAQEPGDPAAIEMSNTGRRSKRLMVLREIGKSLGDKQLFSELDLLLRPGLRLGLVGANGSGKTTLLKIMAGEIPPDAGTVRRLDGLSVVYFEQKRDALLPEVSLRRSLAPEGDSVIYRGQAVHVASWARRFSFRSEQLDQYLGGLSGGEKAKVAIARLMLQPADVLLLDEPTNDLDINTLDILQESLLDFPGAVVLVTHDRYLLDRVCTVLLGLDNQGGVVSLADVAQWEKHIQSSAHSRTAKEKPKHPRRPRKKGLSYLEKREFEGMEGAILDAEQRLEVARRAMEDPAIATDAERLAAAHQEQQQAEAEVAKLYARWAELESKQRGAG